MEIKTIERNPRRQTLRQALGEQKGTRRQTSCTGELKNLSMALALKVRENTATSSLYITENMDEISLNSEACSGVIV